MPIYAFPAAASGGGGGGGGTPGGPVPITTKSANYAIQPGDSIILVNTSGGSFTLTLPDPTLAMPGKVYHIYDIAGALQANPLTLARFAAEMIEGLAANKEFQTNWGGWDITTDGTNWFVK